MKTDHQTRFSSCLDIRIPRSWDELTDAQLRYIFLLQSQGKGVAEIRNLFFLRLTGLVPQGRADGQSWLMAAPRTLYKLSVAQLAVATRHLDWLNEPPQVPVRLSSIGKCAAIDAELHGLPFGEYLMLDNFYQGYLQSQSDEDLLGIAQILYPGLEAVPSIEDGVGIITWLISVKIFFAHKWADLFAPAEGGESAGQEAIMNAMIRALTGGDVLKEKTLLEDIDTWRALTELNEKAREARELKSSMK